MLGMGLVSATMQELASIPNRGRLLDDDFTPTDRALGAVNGTVSEPGPGTRTVVDTDSKLTISSGVLNLAPHSVPAFGDPGFWLNAQTRAAGRVMIATVNSNNGNSQVGFDNDTSGTIAEDFWFRTGGNLRIGQGALTVGAWVAATEYQVAIITRSTGVFYLIKGGAFIDWALMWIADAGSTATIFPGIITSSATLTSDFFRNPSVLFLLVPLVSDGFGGAIANTDGLGHAEGIAGGIGSGGGEYLWTDNDGTWQNAAGVCNASALSGGLAISTVGLSSPDAIADFEFTSRAGGEGGLIIRYADSNNYLRAFHDGTNIQLEEVVAGVPNSLISVVTAFGAGDVIRVITNGTEYRLYYDDALQGTTTGADASLQNNIRFGRYTTNTGNTFDNFIVYARGTANEHWPLAQMAM